MKSLQIIKRLNIKSQYLLLIFVFTLTLNASGQTEDLQTVYQKGKTAYQQKDYPVFLQQMEAANRIRPNHPTITYNLAAAYALNQQPEKAINTLKTLLMMNNEIKFEEDADFESLKTIESFKQLKQLVVKLSEPVENSKKAFTVPVTGNHFESITPNGKKGDFYLGSVNQRSIFSLSKEGTTSIWKSYREAPDLYAVMGMDMTNTQYGLWVCTAALPEMEGYTDSLKGKSSVIQFDPKTKRKIAAFSSNESSLFGDLIVSTKGDVYISDGQKNTIFTIKKGSEKLEVLQDVSEKAFNLQGITLSKNEQYLYFSDYITGLYRLDLTHKTVVKLQMPKAVSPKGIDGLYYYKNTLIATQNGTKPNKTFQLILGKDGLTIDSYRIIDKAIPTLNEPTQGVIMQNHFFYIANSPWQAYDKAHQLDSTKVPPLIILKSTLK